jgi:hypothetical protein
MIATGTIYSTTTRLNSDYSEAPFERTFGSASGVYSFWEVSECISRLAATAFEKIGFDKLSGSMVSAADYMETMKVPFAIPYALSKIVQVSIIAVSPSSDEVGRVEKIFREVMELVSVLIAITVATVVGMSHLAFISNAFSLARDSLDLKLHSSAWVRMEKIENQCAGGGSLLAVKQEKKYQLLGLIKSVFSFCLTFFKMLQAFFENIVVHPFITIVFRLAYTSSSIVQEVVGYQRKSVPVVRLLDEISLA